MTFHVALSFVLCITSVNSFTDNVWNKKNDSRSLYSPAKPCARNQQTNTVWPYVENNANGRRGIENDVTDSVAESVLKDVDFSIDPCTNFYQFSCGGYIRNQTLPLGFASKFGALKSRVLDNIRDVLEETINYKTDPGPLIKAKILYKSCLNEDMIQLTGEKTILSFIHYMGGWPTLDQGNFKYFDFEGMLAKATPIFGVPGLSFLTGGAIIGLNILQDYKQKGRYLVYLDQPGLGQRDFGGLLSFELYSLGRNSIYSKAYIRFGIELMVALGAKPSVAKKDMNDVYTFEAKLARLFLGERERRRVVNRYQKLTIFELSMRYPAFNWLRFFRVFGATGVPRIPFTPRDKIILWAKPYYDGLFPILKEIPARVVANYIIFRSILPLIPALSRKFQLISLRYDAAINGASEPSLPPRNNFCAGITIGNLQWIISRLLVERKLTKRVLSKAIEIKNYIRRAFRKEITMAKWIDEHSRQNALRKFDLIEDNIGFPDYVLDDEFLNLFYKGFDIKGTNFFEDLLEVYIENFVNSLRQLTEPQFDRWILTPAIANAAHERGRNAIVVTAAVLDEPLIRDDYPPALIFGALGCLTAHEYQHAFDSAGIQFNGKGLIEPDFWSPLSAKTFDMKAQCFIQQYSNYFLTDFNLPIKNGIKTLDENLCDNVGLKTAYLAYQAWKSDHGYDDRVPGLPFTGDQLFFINLGRQWCSKWSLEFIFKFPLIDHHSLNRIRVIGPLQNLPEFSSAFQCPVGSFMNPKRKCSFW